MMADLRRLSRGTFAAVAALSVVALWLCFACLRLFAHEGHGGVAPTVRQLRVGNHQWRIAVGVVPTDPLAGELVRIETQAVELPIEPGGTMRRFTLDQIKMRVGDRPIDLRPSDTPTVFRGVYHATESGVHRIIIDVTAGSSATEEFPLQIRAGPLGQLRTIVAAIVAACIILALATGWRRWHAPLRRAVWPPLVLGGLGIALLAANPVLTPILAAHFLPDRSATSIDWILDEPSVLAGSPNSNQSDNGPAQPTSLAHEDSTPVDVVARVVPAPNRTAEILVPIPGRIVPQSGLQPRVGGQVVAGQTLTTLQPTYVMHDALHLINQRWPILLSATDARRRMLEANAAVDRLKLLLDAGAVALRDVQLAQAAADSASQENDRWARTLAMHDVQIRDEQPSRMKITSPIGGQIATANFTQGQLVHEGEPLFTIVDLAGVWAEAKVPERLISAFQQRQSIHFVTPAFRGAMFKGTLQRVAAQLDPETRTLSHFYALENSQKLLRIGMLLTAAPDGPSAEAPATPAVLTVQGRVEAKPEFVAQVTAPIWGRVEFAHKRLAVGEFVKTGEPLINLILELSADERYQMEARSVEIASTAASARIRKQQAELEYQQAVTLMKADPQNRLRQQQVQATEQMFRAATADQELFERQQSAFKTVMERRDPRVTRVTAPISGVVTELDVTPGELNPTGAFRKLLTIVNLSRVWIATDVFERHLGDVLKGVRGFYTVADQDVPLSLGSPVAVLPSIDEKTRTLKVIFEVPNPGGRLRLGMTTRVRLEPAAMRTD